MAARRDLVWWRRAPGHRGLPTGRSGTVRTLMRRAARSFAGWAIPALLPGVTVLARGGGGGGAQPGPSSQGSGAVTHGRLVAGAGGTYLPIVPTGIVSGGPEPRNPLDIPPAGANPQGMTCPEVHRFHIGPGSPSPGGGIVAALSIHPSFVRNAAGGYDGFEARFGYAVPGAIPPGGDPTAIAVGSPATA